MTEEVIRVLTILLSAARLVLPVATFAVAAYMYMRVVKQSRILRSMGINGEIELIHNGWRRDSSMLMAAATVMLVSTVVHDRLLSDGDDVTMIVLASMTTWISVQRLRDRRLAELLAVQKKRKQEETS